ncbi:sugar transferase [Bacteroides faecis]|uniref:sugar transferase n=1 Tax=Bacteroides faecis TaxID=674529 RepID=UPI0011066A8A|nr:sugar transferase [Bacteroides faecis]MDC7979376.1 sugar transferase [Bacteroides faecis]
MTVAFKKEQQMSLASCWVKRSFDIVGSIVGLAILSPAFIVIGALVKREDKGPVLFRQERIGYQGKPFTLYKFRSMTVTAESDGCPMLCQKHDKRLTCIGRFLREHHLDELPQLWNVLKGDMSFVGPRPERRFFIDRIISINPNYRLLYQLRPGLFSTATLYNGYTDTMEKMLERLRMDLEYLNNRSLWTDIKIIFQTVWAIVSGKKF